MPVTDWVTTEIETLVIGAGQAGLSTGVVWCTGLHAVSSGMIHGVGRDARRVAEAIAASSRVSRLDRSDLHSVAKC
jgi:hypothetical protein